MNTYFNDCHNLEDLRKKYIQLMKKYHPDSVTNKNEVEKNSQICQEINFEYEALSKIFPKKMLTNQIARVSKMLNVTIVHKNK